VEEPKKSKAAAAIEASKKGNNKYFDKDTDLLDNIPTIQDADNGYNFEDLD